MKRLKELSKDKIILIIILLTVIINVDLLPIIFMILSYISLRKSMKNKKKIKTAIFGMCLFFTGILSLSLHLPLESGTENTTSNVTNSIVTQEEEEVVVDQEVINVEQETIINDDENTDQEQENNIDETELYLNNVDQIASSVINSEISYNLKNTTLNRLTINENMGTDYDKDVIVLAYLSWSTKNLEKTTREMLEMYSNHLAAKLAPNLEDGSEIALFWDAEYTGLSIKHSYYIKNGNAYVQ